MFGKFQKKYRIPSNRLNNWNYGWNAAYFVTLCTQNRKLFFGEIVDGEMQLSKIGEIVEKEWVKTFQMRTDMNLQMDEYVVMPNQLPFNLTQVALCQMRSSGPCVCFFSHQIQNRICSQASAMPMRRL